ncbi:MAG: Ig-like domain-containing protein [Phycisphaerae bacterium]|nr:Ig-like domain-containing protein [Phycisphaerae bacterium]
MLRPTLLSRRCAHALIAIAVAAAVAEVAARPNIRSAFFDAYPGAIGTALDSVPSFAVHCGVCHYDFAGGGTRNPYGNRLAVVLPGFPNTTTGRRNAVLSIQNEDNESDGYMTLVEMTDLLSYSNTPTFPGLRSALLSNVSNVNLAEIQGFVTPIAAPDTTPPTVTVLSPNGGEAVTGNQPTTITWSATDPSGIALVDIDLSLDNGATWTPLARDLLNTGSTQWFPANRPTTSARVRVLALDNAQNRGSDTSNAGFTVARPLGGRVPTTLRDFDLPGTQPLTIGALNDPSSCSFCHGNYDPAVEPHSNWAGSMMGNASRDPIFRANMAIANQDAPDSGDLCLRCHIPHGWLQGRSVPTNGMAVLPSDEVGVSCDFCHRMVDPVYDPLQSPAEDPPILAALAQIPPEFALGMYVTDPNATRRGPYSDASFAHATVVSPFHREAAFCGTCHDVSNPVFQRDVNGNYVPNALDAPTTAFGSHQLGAVERTYSEWLNSAYNSPTGVYAPALGGNRDYVSTCQHCHMRAVTGPGCGLEGAPVRSDLGLHDLTGGSTWLPLLLPALYPDLVDPAAVAASVERARYMLQNAAQLDAQQMVDELRVRVTNETGHKLPTGYPEGRRMWLNVRFYDAANGLLAESAPYDAVTGTLTQNAGSKVYEVKPGMDATVAGLVGLPAGPSFHFVLNNAVYKDNRIPPLGFTNAAFAGFGGAPVGATYADGQNWDDTLYAIPDGAASVEVTLYYQSTSREFVEFLRDENTTTGDGLAFYNLWNNNGKCPPEVMETLTLPLAPVGLLGDMNCDGFVTVGDISGFVLALTDPAGYAAAYPSCDIMNADVNEDGFVSVGDIGPFVLLLTGG